MEAILTATPIGPGDVNSAIASVLQTTTVSVTTSGNTTLWTCVPYTSNGNTYNPVCYVVDIEYAIPGGTGLYVTLRGSDGTILEGPIFASSYSKNWGGGLSTNPCAAGSNLQINLSGVPSQAMGVTLRYFQL